jgi:hypothetical protein
VEMSQWYPLFCAINLFLKSNKDGGVTLTMIYCKSLCKCHNAPPVQQYNSKEKIKKQ